MYVVGYRKTELIKFYDKREAMKYIKSKGKIIPLRIITRR